MLATRVTARRSRASLRRRPARGHSGRVRHQAWLKCCLFIQTWIPPNTRRPWSGFQIARSGAFNLHFRIRPRVIMRSKRPGRARQCHHTGQAAEAPTGGAASHTLPKLSSDVIVIQLPNLDSTGNQMSMGLQIISS